MSWCSAAGAGKFLAWTLAAQGKRTAVVERRYVGGSCPTIACLPSKNVIHSAKVADYFRRGAEFGIATADWKVEMPAVRERKRKMVDGLVAVHLDKYRESGAELVMGRAGSSGRRRSRWLRRRRDAHSSRRDRRDQHGIPGADRLRSPGLAEARPMTHIEALELDRVPEHLIVLGGGYVGLELAQAMRRFGSRVTILERNDALAHREDRDVSEALQSSSTTRGSRSSRTRASTASRGDPASR